MAEENGTEDAAEGAAAETGELNLHSAGEKLRYAREQRELDIDDIAKATRIPKRHLESLEAGDYAALPGRTYAVGFAKSYARQVDLSEVELARLVREEMEEAGHGGFNPEPQSYAPVEEDSVPPKYFAWAAAAVGVLLVVGFLVWRSFALEPVGGDEMLAEGVPADPGSAIPEGQMPRRSATQAAAAPATGPVVLTATETVWLKIYDAEEKRIYENEMQAGDSYTVPADADNPMIVTGRPDALKVTVGGKAVPPLGTGERSIADVGVSAAALLARGNEDAASERDTGDGPG